jgi:hypothetical protein
MGTELFKYSAESMKLHGTFFEQRRNAANQLGHRTFQKETATLRMMSYGVHVDLIDDNLAMGESQAIKCVKRFIVAMVDVFGTKYLRDPNAQNTTRLLAISAARGFSRLVGFIDCMHWR